MEGLAALTRSVDEGQDGLLRRGLDWLARLVPFDLAAVFELTQGTLKLRMARGPLADNRLGAMSLSLEDFPTIRAALETRRARAFTEADHAHGDGDPFDGVLDFPNGHACMVVPLAAGERIFGVLTLDRSECQTYPSALVDLVEVYGQVLGLALLSAEQRDLLDRLYRRNRAYAKLLELQPGGDPLDVFAPAESPRVRALLARARQVAESETPALLMGELDTGRERLARAIHRWSRRAEQPFVTLDCNAMSDAQLELALFGGGGEEGPSRLQLAVGGTLFLEGLEELSRPLQGRLSEVLSRRPGPDGQRGADGALADVRVLAAATPALADRVQRGRFDESLYFRLSAQQLEVPALRERLEDLPQLCRTLLLAQGARTGRQHLRITAAGLEKLRAHRWPGNLRELANVLERAALASRSEVLGPSSLSLIEVDAPAAEAHARRAEPDAARPVAERIETLEEVERRHIAQVLQRCEGRIYGEGGAASVLGLKPTTLQSRMKKLGLSRSRG